MKKKRKKSESNSNTLNEPFFWEDRLLSDLRLAVQDLNYISETDAQIFPFGGQKVNELSKAEILRQTQNSEDCEVEERDFAEFFDRLTTIQEWFGDEEKQRAKNFLKVRKILEANLTDLRIFKLGKIRIEIYFVGIDSANCLKGIKTFAVET